MEDLPSCTKQEDCNSIPLTYCNTTSGKCECMLNFMPLANPTAGCTPAQCNPNSAPAGVCGAGLVCVGGSCVSSACLDYSASGCHLCASSPALDSEPSSLPEGRSCRSGQAKHNLKAPCGACSASCPSGTCTTPNTYCLPNPSDPTVWSCQAATSCSSAADCPDPNMCCLDGGCVAPVCSGTCVGPCPAGQVCSMTFNPPPNPPTFQCIPVRPLGGCVVLPRPHQLVQRAAEPVLQVTNVKKLHLKANASGNMEIACHASAVRQGPAALPVLQE